MCVVDQNHRVTEVTELFRCLLRCAVVAEYGQQAPYQRLSLLKRLGVAQGNAQAVRVRRGEGRRERCDAFRRLEVQHAEVFVIDPHLPAGERQNPVNRRLVLIPGSD